MSVQASKDSFQELSAEEQPGQDTIFSVQLTTRATLNFQHLGHDKMHQMTETHLQILVTLLSLPQIMPSRQVPPIP